MTLYTRQIAQSTISTYRPLSFRSLFFLSSSSEEESSSSSSGEESSSSEEEPRWFVWRKEDWRRRRIRIYNCREYIIIYNIILSMIYPLEKREIEREEYIRIYKLFIYCAYCLESVLERVWIQIIQVCAMRLPRRINPCPRSLLRFLQRFEGSDAVAEITTCRSIPRVRYTEPSIRTRTIDFSPDRKIVTCFSLSLFVEYKFQNWFFEIESTSARKKELS